MNKKRVKKKNGVFLGYVDNFEGCYVMQLIAQLNHFMEQLPGPVFDELPGRGSTALPRPGKRY
jgi:hypothetical protein